MANLKQRIRSGERLVGTFAFLPSPELVEIMARAGMDYVIIDTEHSPKDWAAIQHMIRAAELYDLSVLVRVPDLDPKRILQCLEIGAEGIVLPFVETAADVEGAAAAMLYPPEGERGTCTMTRMTGYGAARAGFLEHCAAQNDRLVMIAQIESGRGADNIEAILASPSAPDAILVGRSDLASSLGAPGQVDAAPVVAATQRIIDAARGRCGIAMGVYTEADARIWAEAGCQIFFAPSEGILAYHAFHQWAETARAG